jgi:hypothetical protein
VRNGGRGLLAVRNLCVGINMRLATFDADRSVIPARGRSKAASVQQLPQSSLSAQLHVSIGTIGLWIGLMSAADFVHVMYIEDKERLVFGCILE